MNDVIYMQRCLQLAIKGRGCVSPNPMVGCVIVHDNKIISEGFHQCYGQAHAERNAILNCRYPELLSKSTLYVNLEPCAHHGKTPPCADLIIKKNIPKVVYGIQDPNPNVAGKGLKKLRDAGIQVVGPVLEEECRKLNRQFITAIKQKRPYVLLKWAQSKDGFMDIDRQKKPFQGSFRLTDEKLRLIDHKWRTEVDAIMVGTQTLLNDNPQLNARSWLPSHPTRIGIDRNRKLPSHLFFLDGTSPTILYTTEPEKYSNIPQLTPVKINSNEPLQNILQDLHQRKIHSLLVEGGASLLESFLSANLWDEARIFTAPLLLHNGLSAPKLNLTPFKKQYVGKQSIDYFINETNE